MVLEGAGNGRSPTPELINTAASSPSAAYAGLTLESEGSGDASGLEDWRIKKPAGKGSGRNNTNNIKSFDRSSSPCTKRPASDMEEVKTNTQQNDVNMDESHTPEDISISSTNSVDQRPSLESTSKTHCGSGTTLHAPDSLEKGSTSHEVKSKIGDPVSSGAYQTPQSGTSSTASSIDHQDASAVPSTSSTASHVRPTIDDQIEQVTMLVQQPLQEGQKGFVVTKKWLSRVLSRGTQTKDADGYGKDAREGVVGPVDNTGINLITDPSTGAFKDEAGDLFVPLRLGLQISEDFEVLPEEAWNLIIKWYGLAKGSAIIARYCHNTSISKTMPNFQYELYPPVYTVLKLPGSSQGLTTNALKEASAGPIKVLASRHELYQTFLKRMKTLANIDLKTKVRVWRILSDLGTNAQPGMITPAQSRSNSPTPNFIRPVDPGTRLRLDMNSFANLELGSQRELIDAKDETANEKYNGHSNTLDVVGLRQDEVIVLEEQIGGPAGGEWVSDASSRQAKTNGVAISVTRSGSTTVQDTMKPKANTSSGRTSPAPGGMMTRGRQQKNGRVRGSVGLNNLGNTCYMNSALQCIRSVEELTQYFIMDKYKKDLNPNNPLSHNGMVAKAYANLLHEIYSSNVTYSFPPRNFKNVIGKYGPSFSGYQQQDSQEFLLFLLDGLQEDLSRIHKKPYIEKPDSTDEMVHDPVALRAMADKCWDIYQARSDSVITDLFAGMYKSTVICPVCDKVSIIFDPFNNLTLQLPIENVWAKEILFFPLHSRPVKFSVDLDKNASFMALKEYVARKVGVDPKKTIVAEIYKCRFYKMFDDKKSISEERIAEGDEIAVFELESQPSNYPPPKKKAQTYKPVIYWNNSDEDEDVPENDSPLADKMLVPIFNRQFKDGYTRYQQRAIFGVPSYIVVNRDEAKDFDAILRKVLARVSTMTTKNILGDEAESENDSAPEDSDTMLMSTDDGESSSDSKVQAKSLESEGSMIDVSMRDTAEEAHQANSRISDTLQDFKAQPPPKFLRPGGFIAPELRNLFEMKCFSSTSEMIPTGWTTLQDENKEYPALASRIPQRDVERRRSPKSKIAQRLQKLDSPSSSEADLEDTENQTAGSGLQTGYDSDSSGLPDVEQVTQAPRGLSTSDKESRRNSKTMITYSRKGKNNAFNGDRDEPSIEADSPSLIRLGEAIVLDWNSAAHDSLFMGLESHETDESQGCATWERYPYLPDLELDRKRNLRDNRKRNGISLDDCLDEFGKAEILSENDAWYCPRCKEHQRASKTFELWKAPDILVIHLKRFSAQGRNLRDKLDVLVDFPVEGLDLSSRVAMQEDGKSPIYDLFAVDNHYGGLGGGHYTAFAQNFSDKNWYEYNDSSVLRRSDTQAVVTPAAYLLFYRRRASHPLGGPFFQKLLSGDESHASDTQPSSRNESPSGEGKRLGDSSLNGLSSAFTGAEATHQLGGGGLATVETTMQRRTGVDDDLPSYSENIEDQVTHSTLESMELDEDEAIDMPYLQPAWSFSNYTESTPRGIMIQQSTVPPTSDVDEDLFSDESNRAASPASEDSRRLHDFPFDEGTTNGAFGPHRSGSTPVQDIPPTIEDYDDMAVAEVRLGDNDEITRLD